MMKALFFAMMTMVFANSLWAQGQVVEAIPTGAFYSDSSSGVEMIEASRTQSLIDHPVQPILLPTPDLPIQFNQAGIQPAPEPSTFALLAAGLLIGAAVFRRSPNPARP
jgi:PEP-CTERM motif